MPAEGGVAQVRGVAGDRVVLGEVLVQAGRPRPRGAGSPSGASPPTSGISKFSSSSRSARAMSRSAMPSTSGPSGTLDGGAQTGDDVLGVAQVRRCARPPRRRSAFAHRRRQVGHVELGVLEHAVDDRAHQCAAGHVGQLQGDRVVPVRRSGSRRAERRRAGTSSSDVSCCSGSLPTDGLVVQGAGDARVGRPAPVDVERPVEDRRLEVWERPRCPPPSAAADGTPTRSTETHGPQPGQPRLDRGVVTRLGAVGAHDTHRASRSKSSRARGECWLS